MTRRMQIVFDNIGIYGLWLLFAVFTGYAAFQLRATIYFLATLVLENPEIRPNYWTSGTVISLDRLVVVLLGILWLGVIIFSEGYFREAQENQELRSRSFKAFGILGGLVLGSYLVLLLFS